MVAIASSQQLFLTNSLISPQKTTHRRPNSISFISCQSSMDKEEHNNSNRKNELKLAKLAVVTFAAGMLALGSVHEALAAKTGGRVGGQAFRSAAPKASSPRINNSRTNIYINPPVAPPLIGGYGYGVPFYGGYGWSPFSFFAPGPSVAVGVGGGFDTFVLFLVLGVVASVIRGFFNRSRDEDDDY
ncbi:hypothetical protein Syun_024899 [Stephania yunnanensis]